MSETKPTTLTLDADGLTDLQIIAQGAPGKGAAFQRMLDRAGLTQSMIAERIGQTRSSVTTWCTEYRWPKPDTLRRALVHIGIDRKQLSDTWGVLLGTEIAPKSEMQGLAVTLRNELMFMDDALERLVFIGRTMREQVFMRQAFKAIDDTRAAEYFSRELKEIEAEHRLRGEKTVRVVSSTSAAWTTGQGVYATPEAPAKIVDTPTCSDSDTHNPGETEGGA